MNRIPGTFLLTIILLLLIAVSGSPQAVADPSSWSHIAMPFEDEQVHSLVFEGDKAYVALIRDPSPYANPDHLVILDISHPMAPKTIGSLDMQPGDLVVAEGILYSGTSLSLQVFDVSDPGFPTRVSRTVLSRDGGGAIAYLDGYVYIGSSVVGMLIVDVSDPAAPREVSFFDRNVGEVSQIVVAKDPTGQTNNIYAYLATEDIERGGPVGREGGGLVILDVTDPAAPKHVIDKYNEGQWITGLPGIYDLDLVGNKIIHPQGHDWLEYRWGLYIVDVSDPANPVTEGYYQTEDEAMSVATHGNTTSLIARDRYSNHSLYTFDVADKANPRRVGLQTVDSVTDSRGKGRIKAHKGCLYVPQGAKGLRILCETTITPTPPSLVYMPMVQAAG